MLQSILLLLNILQLSIFRLLLYCFDPCLYFQALFCNSFTIGNCKTNADGYLPPKFTSARGNEYFCEIDEEYLTDRFNLTGLNSEVQYYTYALDLINDVFDLDCDDDMREQIEKSARHLYGLVHARYINSTRGLAKMVSLLHEFLLPFLHCLLHYHSKFAQIPTLTPFPSIPIMLSFN